MKGIMSDVSPLMLCFWKGAVVLIIKGEVNISVCVALVEFKRQWLRSKNTGMLILT